MATRLRNSLEFGLITGGVKKKRDTRGNYEFTIRPVSFFLRSDRRSRKERKREEVKKKKEKTVGSPGLGADLIPGVVASAAYARTSPVS